MMMLLEIEVLLTLVIEVFASQDVLAELLQGRLLLEVVVYLLQI